MVFKATNKEKDDALDAGKLAFIRRQLKITKYLEIKERKYQVTHRENNMLTRTGIKVCVIIMEDTVILPMIFQRLEEDSPNKIKRHSAIGVIKNTQTQKKITLETVTLWQFKNLAR